MSAIDRAFIRAYETDDADVPRVAAAPSRPPAQIKPPSDAVAPSAPHFRVYAEPAVASSNAATERRPLSTFTPTAAVESRFRPAYEVDNFRWPDVCDELVERHQARWGGAVRTLLAADDAGRSLVGVAGAGRGVGTTTVLACLARLLIEAGKTVAIVDGHFTAPGLARRLGLAAEIGWEDVLAGRVPLADAVIHSIGDSLTLLPLVKGGVPAAEKLDAIHASVTAGVLRYHYDIVLFDLGAVTDAEQGAIARRIARRCRLDAMLLTAGGANLPSVGPSQLAQTAPELAAICLGLIQNQRLNN